LFASAICGSDISGECVLARLGEAGGFARLAISIDRR
jgi:hypothetical protein